MCKTFRISLVFFSFFLVLSLLPKRQQQHFIRILVFGSAFQYKHEREHIYRSFPTLIGFKSTIKPNARKQCTQTEVVQQPAYYFFYHFRIVLCHFLMYFISFYSIIIFFFQFAIYVRNDIRGTLLLAVIACDKPSNSKLVNIMFSVLDFGASHEQRLRIEWENCKNILTERDCDIGSSVFMEYNEYGYEELNWLLTTHFFSDFDILRIMHGIWNTIANSERWTWNVKLNQNNILVLTFIILWQ